MTTFTYMRNGKEVATHSREDTWDDPAVELKLRALWESGLSTEKIGKAMGLTKNAIVGKAHRLDLPARPSPIRRDPDAKPRERIARVTGSTLPPLASGVESSPPAPRLSPEQRTVASQHRANLASAVARSPVVMTPIPLPVYRPMPIDFRAPLPRPASAPSTPRYGRVIECQWLEGG